MAEPAEEVLGDQFVSLSSTNIEEVNIRAAGHLLKIPRNYLETAQVFMGKVVIGIETTFPDFIGAQPSTLEKLNPANVFKNIDVVRIRRVDFNVKSKEFNKNLISIAKELNTKDNSGALIDIPVLGVDAKIGLLRPIDDSVIIFCGIPSSNPVRCTVQYELADGLMISYEFDKNLLPVWRDLDAGVRKLTTSFLKG